MGVDVEPTTSIEIARLRCCGSDWECLNCGYVNNPHTPNDACIQCGHVPVGGERNAVLREPDYGNGDVR